MTFGLAAMPAHRVCDDLGVGCCFYEPTNDFLIFCVHLAGMPKEDALKGLHWHRGSMEVAAMHQPTNQLIYCLCALSRHASEDAMAGLHRHRESMEVAPPVVVTSLLGEGGQHPSFSGPEAAYRFGRSDDG